MKKLLLLTTSALLTLGAFAQESGSDNPAAGSQWKVIINCTEPADLMGIRVLDMTATGAQNGGNDIYSATFTIDEVAGNKAGKYWLYIADSTDPNYDPTLQNSEFKPVSYGSAYYVVPNSGSRTITVSMFKNAKGVQALWSINSYGLANANRRALAYFTPTDNAGVRTAYFNNPADKAEFKGMQGNKGSTMNYIVGSNYDNFTWTPGAKNWSTGVYKATLDYSKMSLAVESATTIDVDIDGFTTFAAPCDVTLPEGVTAYTLTYNAVAAAAYSDEADNGVLDAVRIEGNAIAAHTPVVLKANTAGKYTLTLTGDATYTTEGDQPYIVDSTSENNVLVGVHQPHNVSDGTTTGETNDAVHYLDNGTFTVWDSTKSTDGKGKVVNWHIVYPFSAYVNLPADVARPSTLTVNFPADPSTPTGINGINSENEDAAQSYNLFGMPVGRDYKGIVIRNGKKYIQK